MDTTKRGAAVVGQTSANEMDVPNRLAWIVSAFNDEDHPFRREGDELSRDLWGYYFHTDRPDPWDAPFSDPDPGAEFTILVPAPTGAGADIFF